MNVLKAVVIFMGVLIVIGSIVVVVTIFNRLTAPEAAEDASAGEGAAGIARFGARSLDLPAGTAIEAMVPDGDRLFLRVTRPDGGAEVVVVDLTTGETVGSLRVGTRP